MNGIIISIQHVGFYVPISDHEEIGKFIKALRYATPVSIETTWQGEMKATKNNKAININFFDYDDIKRDISYQKESLLQDKEYHENRLKSIDKELEELGE